MLREDEKIFFIKDKKIFNRQKKENTRTKQQIKRELETLSYKIERLEMKVKFDTRKGKDSEKELEQLNQLYEDMNFWIKLSQEEGNKMQHPQRKFKIKYKKVSNEKAYKLIMNRIEEIKNDNSYIRKYITKEDTSKLLKIRESQVEQIFRKMNLEGILSQPVHWYAHDNNRNLHDGGYFSGWVSDMYMINEK